MSDDERKEIEDSPRVARTVDGFGNSNAIALFGSIPKAIIEVKVEALRFKSDHGIMKDHPADWKNEGAVAAKPEWTYGRSSAAISHTKNKAVVVEIDFHVFPDNAGAVPCKVHGQAGFGGVTFDAETTIAGGKASLTLTGTALTISNIVEKLTGDIVWTFTSTADPSKSWSGGNTWGHVIYATIDTPAASGDPWDDGITTKRMEEAVKRVKDTGETSPQLIVQKLMALVPAYTLKKDPNVLPEFDHPLYRGPSFGAWPLSDFVQKKAQCQAIVRWVRGLIKAVGLPGTAEWVVVWTDPDDGGTKPLESVCKNAGDDVGLDKAKTVNGQLWTAVLADKPVVKGKIYNWFDKDLPDGVGLNHYEACLRFTESGTKYYAAGVGVFNGASEVVTVFSALCWVSEPSDDHVKIEQVVKTWPH